METPMLAKLVNYLRLIKNRHFADAVKISWKQIFRLNPKKLLRFISREWKAQVFP